MLNGKPDVGAQTRQRIFEAAEKMGCVPNRAARALAQEAIHRVGFMIDPDQETAASSDYFVMGVFHGVQNAPTRNGLGLPVLSCPTGQDRSSCLERVVSRGGSM